MNRFLRLHPKQRCLQHSRDDFTIHLGYFSIYAHYSAASSLVQARSALALALATLKIEQK
jgi:hypothetical protein